jgi:hypothetical protein
MYEKVEFNQLVKGEKYFIRYGTYNKWIIGKFNKYQNSHVGIVALFSNLKKNIGTGWKYKGLKWHMYSNHSFYKYISNNYYKQKIKDKYDEKILKIILKRIVNEDFEWK